jgi:phosphatidylglycerol:prolipoprotein diacylglycerol transferase
VGTDAPAGDADTHPTGTDDDPGIADNDPAGPAGERAGTDADGVSSPRRTALPLATVRLSRSDLLIIALGVIPGAVVGGRVGYLIAHLDYYANHTAEWLDPNRGSLELGVAVVGGTISGLVVARQLAGTARRWLHVAAAPLLVGLGLGKLAMAAGGAGQGAPSDLPWATAYLGAGPWGSLGPAIASHPAQVYEGLITLVALGVLVALHQAGHLREPDGRAFFSALAMWATARFVAAVFWRDPPVLISISAGQLIAAVIALIALAYLRATVRRRGTANAA